MNEDKFRLRQQSRRHYFSRLFVNGLKKLIRHKGLLIAAIVILLSAILLWTAALAAARCDNDIIRLTWLIFAVPTFVVIGFIAVLLYGRPKNAEQIYSDLIRIGMVNFAGEAPVPVASRKLNGVEQELVFSAKGFPYSEWADYKDKIETALNITVLSFSEGENKREVVMKYVSGAKPLPKTVVLEGSLLPADEAKIALGQSPSGGAIVADLSKTPHWLIGAATGMGKSVLLRSIIYQSCNKDICVTVADWKGGVDYPAEFRRAARFIFTLKELIATLETFEDELNRRKNLFTENGCSNIAEYTSQNGRVLPRWLLILDETSMILDVTGRDKSEKEQISSVLNGLLTITRLGRAFGLHLICATQRTSVDSVPGALKANLDGRLAGHTPDDQSSIVLLGTADAAKLPAIPGRFLLRDGSGTDTVFQAYLLPQEALR